MRAPRRHAADAAAADLSAAYERWSAYIDPDIAANVEAVTDWLRAIPAREEAAAKTTTPAAAPAAKAARKPGTTTRERIATQPAASYPLPDPTEPADALAPTLEFGDPEIATPVTKNAMRAAGAHTS